MSATDSTVTYRIVPEFPNYRVGDDGSVWRRFDQRDRNWRKTGERWRRLKCNRSPRGYVLVRLCSPTRVTNLRPVHRLVLELFVGPCPPGMEACHFPDRDPANNALSNLRWDTAKANAEDRRTHGTLLRGESHRQAKITEDQAREVRRLCDAGEMTYATIARKCGVGYHTVWAIGHRRIWRHLDA